MCHDASGVSGSGQLQAGYFVAHIVDMFPLLEVTERGGPNSHAAINAREFLDAMKVSAQKHVKDC